MSKELDNQESYIYDPIVKGADTTFWSEITGTLSVVSNKLRFNTDRATTFLQHRFGELRMAINVPTTPSAGEAKVFGFRNPAAPTIGASYFEITGDVFQAVTYDDEGNAQTTAITWNSNSETWEAAEIVYKIVWERDRVLFFVNGILYVTHSVTGSAAIGTMAQAVDINNADADNTDVGYIAFKRAGMII